EAESKIELLQVENGGLKAQFERERLDHQNTKKELDALHALHFEDVRIHRGIEFRVGGRTGNKWAAFCPNCHLPVRTYSDGDSTVICSAKCGWWVRPGVAIGAILDEVELQN